MRDFEILFEDGAFLVIRKEAGLLSQKNERGEPGLTELLPSRTGSSVFPVHRLDRETGGAMVFAKTEKAAAALSAAIREGRFQKEYLALLTKPPAAPEGTLEHLLFYDRKRGKVFPVTRERKGVKKARLRYQTVSAREGLTLVRVFPETGRTHQIRVQFAAAGSPLAGDRRYGGGEGMLCLFCRALSFPDPETGEERVFTLSPRGERWDLFRNEIQVLPNGNIDSLSIL